MMLKLQKVEESLWGKFFRFEKTITQKRLYEKATYQFFPIWVIN